ncbi:amidohydrolase [Pacificimonas flava]|uniref:Amidohydrolase n=2 Tax=Pacificimonas TaxID=1960290 RepID=A0A219B4Q2_9SPHN|nr:MULTISPECIES: amidohydrolase family protein [Pacificimonas]MBZ6377549.1 amidohydrolase family protein [Pacificimonas aurantium]OWV32758.1 amidohydrolase [Pacificimonas flava]
MGTHAYDLVIRGGTVVDGTGAEPFEADVAISGGEIAAIGGINGRGAEEIDARGQIVTPGFVDVHTHYDGQATWDERMQPSSWHGVTTVVMGNCGVGFAPCTEENRDRLVYLMEGVEDLPFPVLTAGLPWNWESLPQYLDSLSTRQFDVDIGAQVPHAALRVHVMGERGEYREPATPEDIARMADLAKAGVEAGAFGFSTSRTLNHRTKAGEPTPTLKAEEDELMGIAMGLSRAFRGRGAGVLQFVSDFSPDPAEEFAMFRRISERSGRPLSFTLAQDHRSPDSYRMLLAALEQAVDDGARMKAQVSPRAVGVLFGLDLTVNPFSAHPRYAELADLPLEDQVGRLRDPDFRAALLAEEPASDHPLRGVGLANWAGMYPLGFEAPDYEPDASRSVAALAEAQGRAPEEVALDHLLERGGRGLIYMPFLSYGYGSLAASHEMLSHRDTIPGLSDGGAHVGMICDGSFPTSMLTHWTRDRTRGPRLSLAEAVKMQTADTAAWMGLHDRGQLLPGLRADLNVIDYDRLALRSPQVVHDMPAGGRRLMQRADGYIATIVAGAVTYRDGHPTGALPGRLLRGARAAPARAKAAA